MTTGTFGDHLRREREMRGVSLDEISTATRIAKRFLCAIEDEQWDQLPGGVFNRGFVRAVAHYLGLDEESIVAEYSLAAGDSQTVPVWTGSPPAVAPEHPWLAWILSAAGILLLIIGGWFGARRLLAWRTARQSSSNVATSVSPGVIEPRSSQEVAPSSPEPVAPSPVPSAPSGPSTISGEAPSVPTPPVTPNAADVPATSAVAPTVTPAPIPAPPPAVGLALKIEADKKTRITVEADAHRVFEGTIRAGESHTFKAREKFQVSARDSGAVLLELNGQPLAPIGTPGRSAKITLTKDDLKGAAGGGN